MKLLYFIFAIAYIACISAEEPQPPMTEPEYVEEYLESLKRAGFNKDIMPEGNGGHGSPVNVYCTMWVIDVHKVDEYSRDFSAEFYFRQSWNDSRLKYYDKDISEVVLNRADNIWTPDLFFVQEKKGTHHSITTPNTFVRIQPSGQVLYSVRLTVTFSCPMDFSKFPHDIQRCTFSAESYGRTADKIQLAWGNNKNPVDYDKNIKMHDFQLTDVKAGTKRETTSTGTYSILTVNFTFERLTGFYVRRLYVPLILLAIISWASFWIPSKMMALRLSLLLVILYLMVTINYEISYYFPMTSYIKGSDIWIAVCESLVFAAFLQFIAVYIIARNAEKLRKRICKSDPETQRVLDIDAKTNTGNGVTSNSGINIVACRLKNDDQLAKRIDRMSAIIFPIFFAIFNIGYFSVYCTGN